MPEEDGEFTPEQIAKGEQVFEYYNNLPPDAPASPPEPRFKDMIDNYEFVDDKKG